MEVQADKGSLITLLVAENQRSARGLGVNMPRLEGIRESRAIALCDCGVLVGLNLAVQVTSFVIEYGLRCDILLETTRCLTRIQSSLGGPR